MSSSELTCFGTDENRAHIAIVQLPQSKSRQIQLIKIRTSYF